MENEGKIYSYHNRYVAIARGRGGVLYQPDEPDERCRIAILLMHSSGNYYAHVATLALAERGFTVMGANVSNAKQPLENKIQEVGDYVRYLKGLPGIDKVLILGHSGGGTLMSCYQAVAENGAQIFQDDGRIVKMPDMDPMPEADGVLLLDSNFGIGVMYLVSVDPAVTDEHSARNLNSEFDLFAPENGYVPGAAHYSKEFVEKYNAAQEARFDRIREYVLERLDALNRGEGDFEDDEPIVIPGGSLVSRNNRLFPLDISYLNHTKEEYPLLHSDGSITNEIIYTRRAPRGNRSLTPLLGQSADNTTIRIYAGSATVRTHGYRMTETGIEGVDWDSSYNNTPGNVKYIRKPLLIMGMTGGYEFLAAEIIYQNAVSEDKTIAFVEGATHNFTTEKATEKYPGEFGDTVKTCFDFVAKWVMERFS